MRHREKYIIALGTSDVPDKIYFVSLNNFSRFYVYILFSLKDKNWYIGFTRDLKARLIKHAKGQVTSTKFHRPFKLIHYEYFINEQDAKAREVFLKSGFGRNQMKEALKRTLLQF